MNRPSVAVTIVTFDSERYIGCCLEAVLDQEYPGLEVIVVDNGSSDGTREVLERYRNRVRILWNRENSGFAAGQNQAIATSSASWILALNPDVLMLPGFIEDLVEAGERDSEIGTVCGKLLRIGSDFEIPVERRIDSTGMYFTPNMRHFDRGWMEPDDGRFDHAEFVFGASAAAALYRREMIDDVSLEDGFFDPDFFAYREDADVAWRAQLLGWRCLYTPGAVAYHVRRVVPGPRRAVPAVLNMHSVKNRFLMRVKNLTGDLWRRHWRAMSARDALVVGGSLVTEPASLPAFWHFAKLLTAALRKRRVLMRRRRASDAYLASWFQTEPATRPAGLPVPAPARPRLESLTP